MLSTDPPPCTIILVRRSSILSNCRPVPNVDWRRCTRHCSTAVSSSQGQRELVTDRLREHSASQRDRTPDRALAHLDDA